MFGDTLVGVGEKVSPRTPLDTLDTLDTLATGSGNFFSTPDGYLRHHVFNFTM